MTLDDSAGGQGEQLVRIITCVQRETARVERVLPSVDHLALRRRGVDTASVHADIGRHGPAEMLEPFESWRQLLRDFDAATGRLSELRDTAGDGPDYQRRLDAAINEARRCRHAVEEASADLCRRVAAHIDAALAHRVGL